MRLLIIIPPFKDVLSSEEDSDFAAFSDDFFLVVFLVVFAIEDRLQDCFLKVLDFF